jgi:hypothetical protein
MKLCRMAIRGAARAAAKPSGACEPRVALRVARARNVLRGAHCRACVRAQPAAGLRPDEGLIR